MNVVDIIILVLLFLGALEGLKKGAIRSLVTLIGTILLVVVSFYLKDPIASIFLKYLPFFNYSGSFEGLVTLNILVYEAIAYVLVFAILSTVVNLFIKVSGIIEKFLNATIILGIPSKIIGFFLGLIESIVFGFIILFVLLQFNVTQDWVINSKVATTIINKTPFIGNMVNDTYEAIEEINELHEKYKGTDDMDAYNGEILKIMLEKKVIKKDLALDLVESKKLDFNGAKEIIENYEEGK